MEKDVQKKLKEDSLEEYMTEPGDYPNMTSTVSAQECTGMFPALPQNNAQYESLQEMYGMEIPRQNHKR